MAIRKKTSKSYKLTAEDVSERVTAEVILLENRIKTIQSRFDELERFLLPKCKEGPPHTPPQLIRGTSLKQDPPHVYMFGDLLSGSTFRLSNGTQVLIKLGLTQSWNVPLINAANAFYLRTGGTIHLPSNKEVVLLSTSITVIE